MEETTPNNRLYDSLRIPFRFLLLIWAVHLFQVFLRLDLGYLGIYPREFFGLRGVIFSPLLHGDFQHLINNSIPLFALSAMILYFYRKVAIPAFAMIYVLTGLAVWLFGRNVFHIGASGVVYGLVAFVFWSGIFRRNLRSIVLGLIVLVYYSGMFLGILPNQEGVSWESHLLGGLVGILTAYWFKDEIEGDEGRERYSWEDEPDQLEGPNFFENDVFEKTKEQRRREQDSKDGGGWFSSGPV